MKTKNIIALTAGLVLASSTFGQQTRLSNLYNYNKFGLNPAYAGASGCTEINFSHLNQWTKIDGAPTTSFFNVNTRLGNTWGVGANVLLDRLGMLQQFSSSGTVAYGFTIAKQHEIRLGLSAGYFQMRVDPTNAIYFEAGDQIVEGGVQTANTVNTGAGILYRFQGLELSFATQQTLETRSDFNYLNLEGYGLKRHYLGYASYDIPVNKEWVITPNLLYRGIGNVQQFDINADFNYNDFVFGGLGYRTDVGIIGRVGFNVRQLFFIGYAYESPMQNMASFSSGSHEVVLGLKFCKSNEEDPINDPIVRNPDPIHDTVTIVETIHDTLFVERIDTVYVKDTTGQEQPDPKAVLANASDKLEFIFDEAIIVEDSHVALEDLTNLMIVRKSMKIKLEGHTDNRGTEAYNMKLSKSRVEAVRRFLTSHGIEESRIDIEWFGEKRPIADNNTDEGRAKNRRVEFLIISQ